MGLFNFLFGKTKKKVSEFNHSVNYDFLDTLIFYKLADEKFPNHPILIKSNQSFFKIFDNNDTTKLKKKYSEREGELVMPSFLKQNYPSYEKNLIDPSQKKEIKTFWKGCVFKDNFEGICEVYRENGNLFMKYNAVDNEVYGLRQIFDINGNIWENSLIINGVEFGLKVLKSFNDEGFNREEMYDHNTATGTIRGLYNDGKIYFEEEYLKGKKVGVWKEWYQNGKIKWEREYNVILDGVYNEYSENGNPKEIGNFKQSMRSGDWKEYDTKGNLTMSEKWEPTDKDVSKCLERKCFNEKGEEVDCPELTNIRKTFTQQ